MKMNERFSHKHWSDNYYLRFQRQTNSRKTHYFRDFLLFISVPFGVLLLGVTIGILCMASYEEIDSFNIFTDSLADHKAKRVDIRPIIGYACITLPLLVLIYWIFKQIKQNRNH